ncbi:YcjF family protein [Palleronia sp. KMU-117]|uniref:YcjF family protein n=1 Tax=Palleronia sp. KMU-117 TaxID=3434108 RepID=UPI003D73D777
MSDRRGPVLIEIDEDAAAQSPAEAPPVVDPDAPLPTGQAMQTMATLAARRPSALGRWFWRLLVALVTFILSVAAWSFVDTLIARSAVLGYAALVLVGLFVLVCVAILIREWAAISRLARLDKLHAAAAEALATNDLVGARAVVDRMLALYAGRPDLRWGRETLNARKADAVDADALLEAAEADLLPGLDAAARREIEAAARQVAAVTAMVPIAFADVFAALTANVRMIRRIAEIYGGRGGVLGGWRLTKTVMQHLVATGAVAVGDDLIGSVAGGGILSKISRRFGEGVINGALTARVGIAAIEVCRPLPFRALKRPSVTGIVQRALTGLFPGQGKAEG